MRLQILTFLCSLFVFVLATGNLEDTANIKGTILDFARIIDEKDYDKLGKVLSNNVTYDVGDGRLIQGLNNTIRRISKFAPNDTATDSLATNVLIKFLPPYDKEGRSNRAEALSSIAFFSFRAANSTDGFYAVFGRFEDKEIIRTDEPGFGGWRIKNRKFKRVVSFPSLYHKNLSHPITERPSVALKSMDVDLRNL